MSEAAEASNSGDKMNLTVKTVHGNQFPVTCSHEATVLDLKNQLQPLSGIAVDRQRLIFRGSVLADTQTLRDAYVEDGFSLHLVERPAEPEPSATTESSNQHQHGQANRVNMGMLDPDGGMSQGDVNNFIQNLTAQFGGQMHMITHPPIGTQDGSAQMLQLVAVSGLPQGPRGPHQLTALNNFLLHLENEEYPSFAAGPPFSSVSRIGQEVEDERALRETTLASLNGAVLPENLESFLESMRSETAENPAQASASAPPTATSEQNTTEQNTTEQNTTEQNTTEPTTSATAPSTADQTGARDPRRNGLDAQSRPRAVPLSPQMTRLSTLALSQVSRQGASHLQSFVLPRLGQSVQGLRDLAGQESPNLQEVRTGFLSTDGTHPHVTNRIPGHSHMDPGMHRAMRMARNNPVPPGGPQAPLQRPPVNANAATGAQSLPGQLLPTAGLAAALGGLAANAGQTGNIGSPSATAPNAPRGTRGRDSSNPFAHAFLNAITNEAPEHNVRHMRLPITLPGSTDSFRVDMSYVINAIEVFMLSVPPERLSRILTEVNPDTRGGTMRTQMLSSQSEEVRRSLYERFAGPVLDTLLSSVRSYFEQVYRIQPMRTGAEQPTIRPTRRARARTLPSLTHPFQEIPNPAREALLASEQQPSFAGIPFDFGGLGGMGGRMGDFTMPFPGGQMHLQMSMEQVVVPMHGGMPQQPAAAGQQQNQTAGTPSNQSNPSVANPQPASTPTSAPTQSRPNPTQQSNQADSNRPPNQPVRTLNPNAEPFRPNRNILDGIGMALPQQFAHGGGRGRGHARPPAGQRNAAGPSANASGISFGAPRRQRHGLDALELEALAGLCTHQTETVQAFIRAHQPTVVSPTQFNPLNQAIHQQTGLHGLPTGQASGPTRTTMTIPLNLQNPASVSSAVQQTSSVPGQPVRDNSSNVTSGALSGIPFAMPERSTTEAGPSHQAANTSRNTDAAGTTGGLPRLPPRRRPSSAAPGRGSGGRTPQSSPEVAPTRPTVPPPQVDGGNQRATAGVSRDAVPTARITDSALELLQDPQRLQAIVDQPAFQNLAQSPLLNQIMERMFPGQNLDDPVEIEGNTVRFLSSNDQRPRSSTNPSQQNNTSQQNQSTAQPAPDMGQLFSALMPMAQQLFGGLQNGGAATASTARPASQSSQNDLPADNTEFPELASLPPDEQAEWTARILQDRQIQQEGENHPLSEKYHLAVSKRGTRGSISREGHPDPAALSNEEAGSDSE